jgi:hypothetical protein
MSLYKRIKVIRKKKGPEHRLAEEQRRQHPTVLHRTGFNEGHRTPRKNRNWRYRKRRFPKPPVQN